MIASLKIELSECESRVSHLKFLIEEKDGEILRLKEVRISYIIFYIIFTNIV